MEEKEIKLEKKLTPVNVCALALGCIIGWGAFVMPGNTFLPKAGPLGTLIAMGIAVMIMVVIAFNYDYMIKRYPVAGGEFTYAQEVFGRKHAFVCSWFLSLSYLAIIPLNATALALLGRNLVSDFFQVGFHYTVAGYDIYFGEIVLAESALILFAWLSIRGVKFAGGFQTVLAFALVSGVLIVTVTAALTPEVSLESLRVGFPTDKSNVGAVFSVVAVAPWAFVGFDTIPQAAEEFKFSPGKTKVIMIISILFGAGVYVALNTVAAAVIPGEYPTWVEYVEDLSNLQGIKSLPVFYTAEELLGIWGLVFIGIAVLAAILSGIVGFYMATSRLLYSMAKEKVIPNCFSVLNPKYKTPRNAILFIMLISLIAPFGGRTVLGWIVDMSSIGAAIGYAYTSAAAFISAKKEKKRLIMFMGALGMAFAMVFIVLLLVPIPKLDCSLGMESYICLGIWSVLGIIFYKSSRRN